MNHVTFQIRTVINPILSIWDTTHTQVPRLKLGAGHEPFQERLLLSNNILAASRLQKS